MSKSLGNVDKTSDCCNFVRDRYVKHDWKNPTWVRFKS